MGASRNYVRIDLAIVPKRRSRQPAGMQVSMMAPSAADLALADSVEFAVDLMDFAADSLADFVIRRFSVGTIIRASGSASAFRGIRTTAIRITALVTAAILAARTTTRTIAATEVFRLR